MLAALDAGDGGLSRAHAFGELRLAEARPGTGRDHFLGDFEFSGQSIVGSLRLRIGENSGFELVEGFSHLMSFMRRKAVVIAPEGVFCVFFTKAWTRMSRLSCTAT